MPLTVIPRVLREKWEGDVIDGLIELFNQSEQKTKEDVIALSGEKFERRLSEEISGVRSDLAILEGKLEARISEIRVDFKEETASIRADFKVLINEETSKLDKRITEEVSKLRIDISSFKAEIIKWMFLFWIGQLACVAGFIKWLR